MLQGDLGCLCHADRVTAEDLHCRRVLPGKLLEQGQGLLVVVAQGLGGDELRDGISRPQFRADLAEGDVRDPGHGRQSQLGMNFDRTDPHGAAPFLFYSLISVADSRQKCKSRENRPAPRIPTVFFRDRQYDTLS